jgi:hypothetical protein
MATAKQLEQTGTNLYEQDFLAWTISQAEALRARQAVALDWAMIKARPPCVEGVTKPFIGAFSAFLGLLCQNLSCPKKGDFVNKRNARTTKYISACILLLLGSASAWAGASPANTGEIVISHVSDLGKVVTMRGEVEGDKANGFEFLVPGKQFDVKCNSYPYGYPKNPYNHIKKLDISSTNPNASYKVGKIRAYKFILQCPMSGPFISGFHEINKGGIHWYQ